MLFYMLEVLLLQLSFSVSNPYVYSVNKNTNMSHFSTLSACFFWGGGGGGWRGVCARVCIWNTGAGRSNKRWGSYQTLKILNKHGSLELYPSGLTELV